jgi:hypothetical protein
VTTNNFRSRIVAGTLEVPPDAATVRAMATAHVDHLTAEVIVCFTAEGVEESAVLAKLSGYRAWDTAVRQAAHALRVRPFEGPHGPIEACTPVAYRYDRP